MKSLLIIAGSLLIVLASVAQEKTHTKRLGNQYYTEKLSSNGLHSHMHVSNNDLSVPYYEATEGVSQTAQRHPKNKQMRTITFHFDPPNLLYKVILASPDTAFGVNLMNGDQLVINEGYYDLMCYEELTFNFKVILDRLNLNRDIDTTLSLSSATHNIDMEIRDEYGNALIPTNWSNGNGIGFMLQFTQGSRYPYSTSTSTGIPATSIMVTDIPSSMKLLLSREIMLQDKYYRSYVINYAPIENLAGDTILTNLPSDLIHTPLIFYPTPLGTEYYWNFGFGIIGNSSIIGYTDSYVMSFTTDEFPAKAVDTISYYTNKISSDSVIGFFASFIMHSELSMDFNGNYISSGNLFGDTDGNIIMSILGNYPPIIDDYHINSGDTTSIGKGAPFNNFYPHILPGSDIIYITTQSRGMVNERRIIDSYATTYNLWQDDILLASDTLDASSIYIGVPNPGECQLILKNENYEVSGLPGSHRSVLEFDMLNTDDVNPPRPISFKVLQSDKITSEITNLSQASVRFTAGDYHQVPNTMLVLYRTLAQANLYYKEHNSDQWINLELLQMQDEFDSLAGMPYYSNLASLANLLEDSTWVDLQIELVDSAGNKNIQTFLPAFFIKSTSVATEKIEDLELLVFPNPVSGKLCFNRKVASITFYSVDGRKLCQHKNSLEVDMTSFNSGIYIARIISENGQIYLKKIIKG